MRVTIRDDTAPAAWQLVHNNERLRDEIARLRLTNEERAAVSRAADRAAESMADIDAATLRGLLERLG